MITVEGSVLHGKDITITVDNYDLAISIDIDLTAKEANDIARSIFNITEYRDDIKEN